MNVMIWNAARGGMRSVVEAYRRDGFVADQNIHLIAAYGDGGFLARQWLLLKGLAEFTGLLLRRKVSLVHIHAAMRGSFWRKGLFASLARLGGVPVILHLHGSEMQPFYQSQTAWVQALIRRHLERATRVIVLSQSWERFVHSIAPPARIVIVPNHVALPPPVAPQDRQQNTILFLGLVGDRKGVFDLLPAFAQVLEKHPQSRLVIGGNGEVKRAQSVVLTLGIAHAVDLAGWIGPDDKARLLARAGIYTLPSHNEGLPVSVLEAMAYGLPVVTSHAGGLPELIRDGENGLLIEAGDKDAIAAALICLLDDAALRADLGAKARTEITTHYSDLVILPRLRAIYEEARLVR